MAAKFPLAEVRRTLSGTLLVCGVSLSPQRGDGIRFELEVTPAVPDGQLSPDNSAFRRLAMRSAVVTEKRVSNVAGVFDLNEQQALALARELLGRTYRIERVG